MPRLVAICAQPVTLLHGQPFARWFELAFLSGQIMVKVQCFPLFHRRLMQIHQIIELPPRVQKRSGRNAASVVRPLTRYRCDLPSSVFMHRALTGGQSLLV